MFFEQKPFQNQSKPMKFPYVGYKEISTKFMDFRIFASDFWNSRHRVVLPIGFSYRTMFYG